MLFCKVIMFSPGQAALLSIQLLIMCHVFTVLESYPADSRNITVHRGKDIIFTCNIPMENATQINWKKGRLLSAFNSLKNETFLNVTLCRLRIDLNFPSKLNIFYAEHEDAGLYVCEVTHKTKGSTTIEWNLTVLEIPEEVSSTYHIRYILIPAIGLLLCGFISAVCLCRKFRTMTPNQDPVPDQFPPQLGGEVVPPQLQGGVDRRTNNNQRSQYMERLNSIYGL